MTSGGRFGAGGVPCDRLRPIRASGPHACVHRTRLHYSPRMTGRRQRRRNRVSWLVLFALLFQQLAMSAYACTLATPASDSVAMMANCADMSMPASHPSPLCEKHCHPDHATASPVLAFAVPSLGLPPAAFELISNSPMPVDRRYVDVPLSRSDPPPLLRFCSLQI